MMKLGRIERARELYRSGHASVGEHVAREPNNDRTAQPGGHGDALGDVALKGDGDAHTAIKHYLEAPGWTRKFSACRGAATARR